MKPPFTHHRMDIQRRARRGMTLACALVWLVLIASVGVIGWALWASI